MIPAVAGRTAGARRRFRAGLRRVLHSERWLWLLPVLVAVLVDHEPEKRIQYVIAGGIALPALAWLIRRPDRALIALAVFLPLQTVGLGFLLGIHVPASILRPLGAFKELMGIAILLSAVNEIRYGRARLTGIDLWGLGYVLVVTVYLFVPHLFSSLQDSFSLRLLAWRVDCGYVVLFVAVRHAPISAEAVRRFWKTLLGIGAFAVVTGLFQEVAPGTWSRLLLHQGKALQYQTDVLHNSTAEANSALAYLETSSPLRVSSFFESPFDLADYLLVVLAVIAGRISKGYRSRWQYLLFGGVLVVLFATRVRADALAAVVVLLLAVVPAPRKPTEARVRFLAALLLGAVIVVPSLGGTRFVGAQGGSASDAGHIREVTTGIDVLFQNPLGIGLGANPSTANRFASTSAAIGTLTTDNSVTQVGDELGFEGLVPWLIFIIAVLAALRRRARTEGVATAGGGLALLGILVAGQYHHVFLSYDVSWTIWLVAGLALREPAAHSRVDRSPGYDPYTLRLPESNERGPVGTS